MTHARARILVAEDDRDLRELLSELLGEEGYEVEMCERIIEAHEAARRARPDLVICNLTGSDGREHWEIVEALRRDPDIRHIPVILLTAATEVLEEREERVRALDVEVLPKPFEIDDLLDLVGRLLSRGRGTS